MTPGKQFGPHQLLDIVRRRKWLIIAPFLVIAAATVIVSAKLPNRYRSETLILVVPQRVPESYVKSTVTASISDRLQSISQQILSRSRLERIIQDFNLYVPERRVGIMEDVVEQMRQSIDVQIVKGDAFRVSFTGEEPRTVMKVTERLASLFIEENLRDRAVLAEDSYEFIETQLQDARRRLIEHEKTLEEYRRKYAGELPTQLDSNLQLIQTTQMQVQNLNESVARDRDRRLVLERLIADASTAEPAAPAAVTTPGGTPAPGSAVQQLEGARQQLRQLELRLTPEHPDIVRAKRELARLEANALAEAGTETAASPVIVPKSESGRVARLKDATTELQQLDQRLAKKENDEKLLRAAMDRYQARVESTPSRESDLIELSRDYDTLQKTYQSLLMKKEDSKLAANLERRQIGEQFKILDPARVPEKPFSPDRSRMNLLGALFGLGVGFGLAALLEFNDTTLKTDEDVVQLLALPVLAMVPLMVTPADVRSSKRWRTILLTSSGALALALISVGVIVWTMRH